MEWGVYRHQADEQTWYLVGLAPHRRDAERLARDVQREGGAVVQTRVAPAVAAPAPH